METLTDFLKGCESYSARRLTQELSADDREFHTGLLAAYRNVSAFIRNTEKGE